MAEVDRPVMVVTTVAVMMMPMVSPITHTDKKNKTMRGGFKKPRMWIRRRPCCLYRLEVFKHCVFTLIMMMWSKQKDSFMSHTQALYQDT